MERIKTRIENLKKIPIDSQTLLSGAVKLENDRTIKSYNISNEATLHVSLLIIIYLLYYLLIILNCLKYLSLSQKSTIRYLRLLQLQLL